MKGPEDKRPEKEDPCSEKGAGDWRHAAHPEPRVGYLLRVAIGDLLMVRDLASRMELTGPDRVEAFALVMNLCDGVLCDLRAADCAFWLIADGSQRARADAVGSLISNAQKDLLAIGLRFPPARGRLDVAFHALALVLAGDDWS